MGNSEISLDKKVYGLLKQGLDVSGLRSKISANNIANINTKGFKKQYVTFEESLKKSQDKLKLTDEKHIDIGSGEGEVKVERDTSTSMREDGNNVDVENEMVNQAANTLMHYALISEINNRMTITKYIINGR